MLSPSQRTTILELHQQGVSKRQIARVLGVSRLAVRRVLGSNSPQVPELHRPEKAEPYRPQILELFATCKGNLVRVHEELTARGAPFSYQALTAFCRRHGIGQAPPVPAGQYHFAPGEEMQHDTSPHELELAGKQRKGQTASAVRCYSRMLFFQCYPTFQRFDCKVFLTAALRYFAGAAARVMIDKGRGGRIINIASIVGATGNAGQANYAASKAGLVGLARSLARELGSRNITCNVVAPGFVDTDMTAALPEERKAAILGQVPLGRLASADEIASVVAFLASDDAAYITGAVIPVDGGLGMGH